MDILIYNTIDSIYMLDISIDNNNNKNKNNNVYDNIGNIN